MEQYHDDMKREGWEGRVGVFICGSPVIGKILSELCQDMTERGRADGSQIQYVFMIEVFG